VDRLSHTKVQKLACPLIGFYSEDAQVWQGRRHTLEGWQGTVQVKSPRHASSEAILSTTINRSVCGIFSSTMTGFSGRFLRARPMAAMAPLRMALWVLLSRISSGCVTLMKAKHEVASLLLGLATGMASWPKVGDRRLWCS
jgi:hypothetical protein